MSVWESDDSVSSPDVTPRSLSNILRCASNSQLFFQCFMLDILLQATMLAM